MYPLLKDENYQNLGGINTLSSVYTTEERQFLDLRNFTFERLGSLTSRNGYESYLTLPVNEFLKRPFNSYEYLKIDGSSFLIFDSGPTLHAFGSSFFAFDGSLTENATTSAIVSFVTANDFLYYTAGDLKRFDGSESIKVSVSNFPDMFGDNTSFNTGLSSGSTAVIPADSYFFSGFYLRGTPSLTDGKINEQIVLNPGKYGAPPEDSGLSLVSVGSTIASNGKWEYISPTLPPTNEGVSSVAIATSRLGTGITNIIYSEPQSFFLTTISGTTNVVVQFEHFSTNQFTYETRGPVASSQLMVFFNNMLVSIDGNDLSFSTLQDIESFLPENKVSIIGNPGDDILAATVFQGALVIFKEDSIHEIRGASPETLSLTDITFEYGCLSRKGFCIFQNRLWFIDRKGICEYDGANVRIVSEPIDSFLNEANKSNMAALHVKKKNEVWFGDGEKVFKYDYAANAWGIYDVLDIDKESGAIFGNYGDRRDVFFWEEGASFHQGFRFSDDIYTDNGQAITLMAKTRYHKRLGPSTQEMWRRLYINANIPGATTGVTVNYMPNYASDVSLTQSLFLDDFQKRLDFGLSAKSMGFELIIQSAEKIVINGYTIESRFLRSV